MLTEIKKSKQNIFNEEMIVQHLKIVNGHGDGITCIELIAENDAFITSSFDCCCHIWSIQSGEKLGSLLLGGDPNWKIVFNLEQRRQESRKEAEELLQRIGKRKISYFVEGATEEEQREMQIMKQNVLKGARDLLENQKKVTDKN